MMCLILKRHNAHWNKLTQNLVILIFSEYGLFGVNTHMGSQSLFYLNKRIYVYCALRLTLQ